jgi:GT2 family glycosyltransferase
VRISHVIATKARPESLRIALESSVAALSPQDEVIVVDGDPECSGRPIAEGCQAHHPGARVRYVSSAPGLPLQRNVGIDAGEGEVVVFTDDDCTFAPTFFDDVLAVYRDPTLVGVTGFIREPSAPRFGSDTHSRLRWLLLGGGREGTMTSFGFRRPIVRIEQARDVEYMPGPLMTARRQIAAEVRFDERLAGYALGEDDDFSYRLSRRGRVRYDPSVVVDHNEIGFRTMDLRARDRQQIINRTYLYRKNFRGSLRGRVGFLALIGMLFVHRVLNREWNGVRGLVDGLREVSHS